MLQEIWGTQNAWTELSYISYYTYLYTARLLQLLHIIVGIR